MKIRKIAALLATVILLSLCPAAAFAEDAGTDEAYKRAVRLLEALGVSYFSRPDGIVTYHSFNDALGIALDIKNTAYDITELTGISYSADTGANPISYDDAVRSLVNLTGYKVMVLASGGELTSYISTASSKGILSNVGIRQGESITARDAAVLIYNALGIEVLQCVYGGSELKYKTFEDETLLYKYRKMQKGRGVVEGNRYTTLYADDGIASDGVVINGKLYTDYNECTGDYLAYAVEFYYCENNDNNGDIIFAYPDERKNSEIVIDGNFRRNTGRQIYYLNESGREKNEYIPDGAAIIYNGVALDDYDNTIFDFSHKRGVIIDNNSDGKTDALLIYEGVNRYISHIETEHGIVYDGLSKEEMDLVDNEFERIRIIDGDGKSINMYSLAVSDVISVYTSKNGRLMEIRTSHRQVMGRVEGLTEEDGIRYASIAGVIYPLSAEFVKYELENLKMGENYNFFLSHRGEIVYMKQAEAVMRYGYAISSGCEESDAERIWLRILAEDGEINKYPLKDKVKIDGKTYKEKDDAAAAIKVPQLVRYDINESGEIYAVDTPERSVNETDNTLSSFGMKKSLAYNASLGGFEGRFRLGENTLVFFCPSNGAASDYGVVHSDFLKTSTSYNVQAFVSSATNYIPDAIVVDAKISDYKKVDKFSKSYAVVDKKLTINDDGDTVYRFELFNKITKYTVECTDIELVEGQDIHIGDVINASFDSDGRFCDIVKVYDSATHTRIKNDVTSVFEGTEFTSRCFMRAGYVYYCDGTTIGISETAPGTAEVGKGELEYLRVNDSLGVIVDSNYDTNDERHIRRVSMAEVRDYLNYKNCAKVFVRMDQSSSTFIVVYQ